MSRDRKWTEQDIPELGGMTFIVTGANTGIGFQITLSLAQRGAKVIMACRDFERTIDAIHVIKALYPDSDLKFMQVDLASLKSIRKFCHQVNHELERIDVLINNAGVMATPFMRTEDGFEYQMGINHFGHFTLTGMVLDKLMEMEGARVVNVSSSAHRMGSRNIDDLNYTHRPYFRWTAYAQSKLANLWFTYEMNRRIMRAGHSLSCVAAHPGVARTALLRHNQWMDFFGPIMAQSAQMGALPVLYAAVAPSVDGGQYYGPDGFREMRGYPVQVYSNSTSHDEELAASFWCISEELTGFKYAF